MLAGTIPTSKVIHQRTGKGERCCVLCGFEHESYLHVFKDCHAIRSIAFRSKWGCKLDAMEAQYIQSLVKLCVLPKREVQDGLTSKFISIFLACLFYSIWNFKNEKIFENKKHITQVIANFEMSVDEFAFVLNCASDNSSAETVNT